MNKHVSLIGVILITIITFVMISDVNAEFLTTDSVLTASGNIKTFVEKNGQLPNYVTIGNGKYSMDQYLYISSNFIACERMGALKNTGIVPYGKNEIKKASKPTPRTIKTNIDMLTVYDMSERTANYITKNKKTPCLIGSKYGDVQFQTAIYGYAKILDYYKKNKIMPNYVTLNVAKNSKLANYMPNF